MMDSKRRVVRAIRLHTTSAQKKWRDRKIVDEISIQMTLAILGTIYGIG